jgi:hypothetical protein
MLRGIWACNKPTLVKMKNGNIACPKIGDGIGVFRVIFQGLVFKEISVNLGVNGVGKLRI